jgi:hypothetical protein
VLILTPAALASQWQQELYARIKRDWPESKAAKWIDGKVRRYECET